LHHGRQAPLYTPLYTSLLNTDGRHPQVRLRPPLAIHLAVIINRRERARDLLPPQFGLGQEMPASGFQKRIPPVNAGLGMYAWTGLTGSAGGSRIRQTI